MPVVAAAAASLSAAPAAAPPVRLLRVGDVADRLGLSRSQVWRMVSEGRFPKPRRLSVRAVAWLESEVAGWITARPLFDGPDQPKHRARR